jgi:hypothetical protein
MHEVAYERLNLGRFYANVIIIQTRLFKRKHVVVWCFVHNS